MTKKESVEYIDKIEAALDSAGLLKEGARILLVVKNDVGNMAGGNFSSSERLLAALDMIGAFISQLPKEAQDKMMEIPFGAACGALQAGAELALGVGKMIRGVTKDNDLSEEEIALMMKNVGNA